MALTCYSITIKILRFILKDLIVFDIQVHYLTIACLVWLWMRREVSGFGNNTRGAGTSSGSRMFQHLFPLVVLLTIICSYKTLLLDLTTNAFELGSWTSLALKAFLTTSLGLITLQIYVGITTVLEKYWRPQKYCQSFKILFIRICY